MGTELFKAVSVFPVELLAPTKFQWSVLQIGWVALFNIGSISAALWFLVPNSD